MTKTKDLLKFLQDAQRKIQIEYSKRITPQRKGIYERRGVWITLNCACGHEFRTVFYPKNTGKCPVCKKLFYRALKKNAKLQ